MQFARSIGVRDIERAKLLLDDAIRRIWPVGLAGGLMVCDDCISVGIHGIPRAVENRRIITGHECTAASGYFVRRREGPTANGDLTGARHSRL